MEAGENEMRKVYEEVTTRNVHASIDYSNETRKIVRELEEKVLHLEGLMREQNNTIAQLTQKISIVQGKLYSGGTD